MKIPLLGCHGIALKEMYDGQWLLKYKWARQVLAYFTMMISIIFPHFPLLQALLTGYG